MSEYDVILEGLKAVKAGKLTAIEFEKQLTSVGRSWVLTQASTKGDHTFDIETGNSVVPGANGSVKVRVDIKLLGDSQKVIDKIEKYIDNKSRGEIIDDTIDSLNKKTTKEEKEWGI